MIKIINEDNIKEFLTGKTLLVFSSPTCPPCKRLMPILESVSDNISVGKIQANKNLKLSNQYAVTTIPATFVMDDDEVVHRFSGVFEVSELEAYFDA